MEHMTIEYAFIGSLGPGEIILALFAILLLFGAKRLPELAKGLGKGIREFKGELEGVKKEIDKAGKTVETNNTDETTVD